jgi:gliding motility-associated protein GldL
MAAKIPPKVSKWFDVGVSVGAAVVIYGALQKILHTSIADHMLRIGLTTEALIFLGYGVLYIIYPYMDDHEVHIPGMKKTSLLEEKEAPLSALEKMLADAGITTQTFTRLNENFGKLHSTVSQMGEFSDVVKSASDFSAKTKEAATALGTVSGAVTQVTHSLQSFNAASESTKQFHAQVQVLTKNLSSLNTIYELELQESNSHLKALNQFYGKLAQASAAMNASADDALKAKEQIGVLANNLGRLNQVYGSMLSAMQGRQ